MDQQIIHNVSSEEKAWAAASYLWLISIIVLAVKKDSPYIRFHANQGAFLFLISLIAWIFPPLYLVIFGLEIVGLVMALQGKQWELPLIGGVAKSFGDWLIKTLKI
jgi:uncharacterized membrane protein